MKPGTTKQLTLLTLFVLLSACASKEHFSTAKEINEECQVEMQAALTAVRLRNEGKPKSVLLAPLPAITEQSSRLLVNLHTIVDETYQYPALNEMIYPTYRFDLCLRALQQKPYPVSLAAVEPALLNCQRQFGLESSAQSTQCVSDTINALAPGQLINPQHPQTPNKESKNEPET
jgi:hypothetical protein